MDGVVNDTSATNPLPTALTSTGGLADLALLSTCSAKIGDPVPTRGFLMTGEDGTGNAQSILTDTFGRPSVTINTMPNVTIGTQLPAGSNNIGDVDVLSIAAGSNLIGKVQLSNGTYHADVESTNRLATVAYQGSTWQVQGIPGTSGGCSISRLVAANSTNATVVKASAGQLYGYEIYNASGATSFVKLVNKATSPTAGSETVAYTLAIPTVSTRVVWFPEAIAFSTGITFFTVTGFADSNSTAVAANDLIIQLFYK